MASPRVADERLRARLPDGCAASFAFSTRAFVVAASALPASRSGCFVARNRNETKHLPYGEGTLRAEPLAQALAEFDRPATLISESPDEESHQSIRKALLHSGDT